VQGATAEQAVQVPPPAAPARAPRPRRDRTREQLIRSRPGATVWGTLLVAGAICLVTFYAKGGRNLETMTATEMGLTIAAGVLFAASLLVLPLVWRRPGSLTLALLLALTALTALSVVWSVQPDASWRDAGRLLAYSGVFAASIAIVRVAPDRWSAVLGGIVLAAVAVCAYGLASKVFPSLAGPSPPARLREPFGYWNAVGLAAAMGVICCMWLGARRRGHALISSLSYPACGLLLLTLLLAYSRGALAALAVGVVLWLSVVPLRLRGASVLVVGGLGAGAVAGWDFSQHALSAEGVALAQRTSAGHELGALALVMLAVLTLAGVSISFFTSRRAPTPRLRRRIGVALWTLVAVVVIAAAGALAHSHRGLGGSISHGISSLTNPNAKPPPNTPGRLTAVASVRARYWKEGLEVFGAHPALGVGAEGYATARLRYRKDTLVVTHAHGFLIQTLADLGIVGLLLALALLASWIVDARRGTRPLNRPPRPYTPERIGLLSMLCVVVVFGAHSLIDWTWYVPGNAFVALLCAGWLAGRGRLATSPAPLAWSSLQLRGRHQSTLGDESRRLRLPGRRELDPRVALAAVVILAALLAAWAQWEPQRSEEARTQALALAESGRLHAAANAARSAASRDPLSAEALTALADVQSAAGNPALARATLQRAVRLQPSNPQTWLELARADLQEHPSAALKELQAAIYLNPQSIAPESVSGPAAQRESIEIYNDYIGLLRSAEQAAARG
jgi:O-antigen ligase